MKIKIMKFNTEIQKYRKLYFRSIISPNTSAEFSKNIISIQKYTNTESCILQISFHLILLRNLVKTLFQYRNTEIQKYRKLAFSIFLLANQSVSPLSLWERVRVRDRIRREVYQKKLI